MSSATTSQEFFESMYTRDADPWRFASSGYERSRYAATLQALRHRRYQRSFEPGCAIGVLTRDLARLSETVEAIDISPTAVEKAQQRCRDLPHVNIRCGTLPQDLPDGDFDLIVFSEIGYYFDVEVLRALGAELVHRLRPGGVLLAVHWLGTSSDHVLSGDQVHETLLGLDGLQHEYAERHGGSGQDSDEAGEGGSGGAGIQGYRLDRWVRP